MSEAKRIQLPLPAETVKTLKVGDLAYITGAIYTARDAAHKKMFEILSKGGSLPFEIENRCVYYAGPCPAPPGQIIGSIGPTTSGRMDAYSPFLIECGLRVMIGKGLRSVEVVNAIKKYNGIYFAAVGGAAALMSKCVKRAEVIAFDELGTEAVRELIVEDLPVVVAIDCLGGNIYSKV